MASPIALSDELKQWRKAQRAGLLARREAATDAQRLAWNDAITSLLAASFPMLQSMTVGFYWPYRGEFDARFAIRRLRESGARVALPVVLQKGAPLEFREWWPGVPMTKGVFDLPIPMGTDVVTPGALLIPPIGFDSHGYRLGYGGGYFDRTLAAMTPQPLKIGVAFELSRIPTIQPQPHDVPMDFIATEAGVHYVGEGGLERVSDASQVLEIASVILRARHPAPHDGEGSEPGAQHKEA
jgi:5-formyltetrahydrofolate cyclo-ligase